jgi:hypothetical protein
LLCLKKGSRIKRDEIFEIVLYILLEFFLSSDPRLIRVVTVKKKSILLIINCMVESNFAVSKIIVSLGAAFPGNELFETLASLELPMCLCSMFIA